MIALWVALGAVVGAPVRYLTDRACRLRLATDFPVGTLAVNLCASFGLGVVTGAHAIAPQVAALVGTGFCATLSTWSTFAFESLALADRHERTMAGLNVIISVVGGIGLAALGWAIAAATS